MIPVFDFLLRDIHPDASPKQSILHGIDHKIDSQWLVHSRLLSDKEDSHCAV